MVGFNKRALRFWESLGFKKEGIERDEYYYDNKYSDGVMMSILEDEFKKANGAASLHRIIKSATSKKTN